MADHRSVEREVSVSDPQLLRLLVDKLPAMVAYWDAGQRLRFANGAYERWFGVKADELLGRDMRELLGPLYALNQPFIEGALRGEEQEFEREIPSPRGAPPRYTQIHYVPDVVHGTVRGFCVLVVDITRRHEAEEALYRMGRQLKATLHARDAALRMHADQAQALTTLAGEIAHELKNPLATIAGLAALVAREVDGRAAERMRVLKREADRMAEILEEFLNFSRPLVPLALARVDLRELCEEVALLHEGLALEKGVTIRVAAGTATALCDARKVKQVLVNVLQNALASTPAGLAIDIEVASGVLEGGGSSRPGELGMPSAFIRVRDCGPGLPPEIADRVFEPGVSTKGKGSGFGLTISRMLARQHGGDLTIRSSPSGCTVELAIPENR